ncbi:ATP-binding protein [Zavarzinia sp. CC-PAN008]|uniref:sensor histidine kinase n=1 Tax=Zavarzinia sp. CC-PAN008 TaxID=3243332 RepID=UPI003F748A93
MMAAAASVLLASAGPAQAAEGIDLLLAAGIPTGLLAVGAVLALVQGRRLVQRANANVQVAGHLRRLVEDGPVALVVWDRHGQERVLASGNVLGTDGLEGFRVGLGQAGAERLDDALGTLRRTRQSFDLELEGEAGRHFSAAGRAGVDSGGVPFVALWLSDRTAAAIEVSALAESNRALMRELARQNAALDALPLPVWRRGEDLSVAWVNRAFAHAMEMAEGGGVAPGAQVEFSSQAMVTRARDLAAQARGQGAATSEKRFVIVEGQRRAFDVREVPLAEGQVGIAIDMTALEEARADLARHIEAHSEALNSLTTAISIFGPDKRLMFHNNAYARLMGLSEDFLDSHPLHAEVVEALRERRRLPEQADFPAWKRQRLNLYQTLIEPQEDLWHLSDGTTLRIVTAPHPLGGLIFLHEDVTDRLALERSVSTLSAVQRETLNNLYEGVAVFGSDGRLKLFNPAYGAIWKLDAGFLDSHPHIVAVVERCRALVAEDADWPERRASMIATVTERQGGSGQMERPDGTVVDFAAVPLSDGDMLITYIDVTDSVMIERALRERNEALMTADRLKSEFISNVSYELRTPLNSIIGFTEILANAYFGPLNERQKSYTADILASSRTLLSLINDILDLAVIEAGAMELERGPVDVAAMMQAIAQLMLESARKMQLTLEVDCSPDVGTIEGDSRRLRQVLVNLVSNALKFTGPTGRIVLGADRQGDFVRLWVADTGIGIDPADQKQVFERFETGGNVTSGERRQGAGLGLALVRSFVELHGGTVDLESEPNHGTRVICHLPVGDVVA